MYFRNLSKAFLAVLLEIDRFFNALSGGYYKATISARVGYYSKTKKNPFWKFLEWVIDETFRPIDGRDHCQNALEWEGVNHYRRSSDVALAFLSIFVVIGCLIIAIPIYLIALFR